MTFAIHLLNGVQILNTELDPSKCNKYYIKILWELIWNWNKHLLFTITVWLPPMCKYLIFSIPITSKKHLELNTQNLLFTTYVWLFLQVNILYSHYCSQYMYSYLICVNIWYSHFLKTNKIKILRNHLLDKTLLNQHIFAIFVYAQCLL